MDATHRIFELGHPGSQPTQLTGFAGAAVPRVGETVTMPNAVDPVGGQRRRFVVERVEWAHRGSRDLSADVFVRASH